MNRTTRYGSAAARELHRLYPPIDLHGDSLLWASLIGYDLGRSHRPFLPKSAWFRQVDLPRLEDGLVGGQFFGLVSLPRPRLSCLWAVNQQIDRLDDLCRRHPKRIVKVRTCEEAATAADRGALAAFLGVEGAHAVEGGQDDLYRLARRGIRYLGLAHFSANRACRPAMGLGRRDRAGLTRFGQALLRDCEALGVIVDLAHVNRRGFLEACRMARRPVLVSHTGISGAYRHWRNIDDAQVRAVASTGGVIGIIFSAGFLGGSGPAAVVRHMEHIIGLVGDDHVALGSDYDGMIVPVSGLSEISMLPNLTDAMLDRGWRSERIGKVLRGNVMRLLGDVPVPANMI
ncbi:peptidase [Parcubacteria bacterium SG8_24]|nr:MAG: peptidase [Parcubacteria bacterium SG8_24]